MEESRQHEPLLTTKQAAAYLNCSPRTLEKARCLGGGVPYVALGARAIRYRRSDLFAYVEERIRRSTSDDGEWQRQLEEIRGEQPAATDPEAKES